MDIYFRPEYALLGSLIDGGTPESFAFDSEYGSVVYHFIKRQIPQSINDEIYFDIITPYGYGGPCVNPLSPDKRTALVEGFCNAFSEYCLDNNIVSEFVRFHPVYNNAEDFKNHYDVTAIRKTVGTDLASEDPVKSEFNKSCRKNIRKALKSGITYRVTRSPESIDGFLDIYYSTMDRDKASEYYYFDKNYFDKLLALFKNDLIYTEAFFDGKIIAASICFVSDDNVHIHLSGTLSEYLYLSPAYILRYAVVEWGKKNSMKRVHHGGGVSNSPGDSLYLFKKQFGINIDYDFYVGKMIRNRKVYDMLCEITGNSSDCEFFPAYRKR